MADAEQMTSAGPPGAPPGAPGLGRSHSSPALPPPPLGLSPPEIKKTVSLRSNTSSAPRMPHHYELGEHGGTISWDAGSLILDGKRTLIFSGEFHYWRFPDASEWESVLRSYLAAGLNAVRIYFHWGFHSPRRGVYRFGGNRDVDGLLALCERLGLYVLAAPGPYICAETSGGGFPFWLLEDRSVRIRHMATTGVLKYDETFMDACSEWYEHIVPHLARHEITKRGGGAGGRGCVILFQVDNELFEKKIIPLGLHRHMYELSTKARSLGVTVPFFHDDGLLWGSWLGGDSEKKYSVDLYGFNLYVIFAPGSVWGGKASAEKTLAAWSAKDFVGMVDGIETGFRNLGRAAITSPIFIPELQAGWFNRWGLKQGFDDLYQFYGETFMQLLLASVLAQGCSLASMYTFCGGTNWGALPDPDVYTSYDYAAPLREYRHPSTKLALLRSHVINPVRALEYDFATAHAVGEGTALGARCVALDGAAPSFEGFPLLAKQRSSARGVQLCLLRNLAPSGKARRVALHLGGAHAHAELEPRTAFFAIGHVYQSSPYLLLSGVPVLSYGRYGGAAAGGGAGAAPGAGAARRAAGAGAAGPGGGSDGAATPPSGGGAGVDPAAEDVYIVRCVPTASMCFRGHLAVLSASALPRTGLPAADAAASATPAKLVRLEHGYAHVEYPDEAGLGLLGTGGRSLVAGCLPVRRQRYRRAAAAAAAAKAAARASPIGMRARALRANLEGVAEGDERGGSAKRPPGSAKASLPSVASDSALSELDSVDEEPLTWVWLLQPCAVRLTVAAPPPDEPFRSSALSGRGASAAPAAGAPRPSSAGRGSRTALLVCLGDAEAPTVHTHHGSDGSFGACWGVTAAHFAADGSSVRVTATGQQVATILPPAGRAPKPARPLEPAKWAAGAAAAPPPPADACSATPALAVPPPKLPPSPALTALCSCVVGLATPPSAELEAPLALTPWEGTTFDWGKISWKEIDIKKYVERDSLYSGLNGGLSFYRCTFECAGGSAKNIRLRLNARHRVAIYCNGGYVGSETIYASAMLKAGAPNGPDITPAGARVYPLRHLLTRGTNELRVIVHSFGQSRCPVILDDARNPRGILSASLKGGAAAVRWAIGGLDCKQLDNAFATDGVPPEALGTAFTPLPSPDLVQPAAAAAAAAADAGTAAGARGAAFTLTREQGLVHARAAFTRPPPPKPTPEGGAVRLPLRATLEGSASAYLSLNGTPVCRYHGDMGPQTSFFLPDGLLKPPGQPNVLTLTAHTTQPTTVLRVRVRPYDIDMRSGNIVETAAGGKPLQTTSVDLSFA